MFQIWQCLDPKKLIDLLNCVISPGIFDNCQIINHGRIICSVIFQLLLSECFEKQICNSGILQELQLESQLEFHSQKLCLMNFQICMIIFFNFFQMELLNFLILLLALYYVTFQYGRKTFLDFFFAHKKLKKPPQKVAYLWQLGVLSLQPRLPKTAQNLISVL